MTISILCITSSVSTVHSVPPCIRHVTECPASATLQRHGRVAFKKSKTLACSPALCSATAVAESDERLADVERDDSLAADDVDKCSNSGQSDGGRLRWDMLLSTEALGEAHLLRAGSVTDAHVLRRKGRLKEQDGLIEFIISMHRTHSPFQVMEKNGEMGARAF